MRNSKGHSGAILILFAVFLFAVPFALRAQDTNTNGKVNLPADGFSSNGKVSLPADGKVNLPPEDIGTGIFSTLPFKVTFNLGSGYDDNVTTTHDKHGSAFSNVNLALTYNFGSPRTQIQLETGGGYTYYWDDVSAQGVDTNNYDVSAYVRFALVHKASARLTLSTTDYVAYQTEPDFTLAAGSNQRSSNYFFTQDKFTANYLWAPRFATATSYTLGGLHYDDDNVGFYQDRWENTFGNEFRFLLSPSTTLVAEYRFQIVSYEQIARDSTTHFVLGGFDHTFNPRLNMSFRGGAEFRNYENDGDKTSPYFEGTLNYALGKQTTVAWSTRYAIEEPDVLLSQSRKTFRTGLAVKHDLTTRISGSLGAYYEHDDYQSLNQPNVFSPGFNEDSVDLAVSVRYGITRYIGVQVGYNYTDVWSDMSFREYSRNRVWGGLNLVF